MSVIVAGNSAESSDGQSEKRNFVGKQANDQWLARVFLGASVRNSEGHIVGDINDLVFDKHGQISSAVLGVGGFLGMGEKMVAVPFLSLSIDSDGDGARRIVVNLSRNELMHAPTFEATEKTTFDNMREIATGLGSKASVAVVGLKDQAVRKIDEMNKDTPRVP